MFTVCLEDLSSVSSFLQYLSSGSMLKVARIDAPKCVAPNVKFASRHGFFLGIVQSFVECGTLGKALGNADCKQH